MGLRPRGVVLLAQSFVVRFFSGHLGFHRFLVGMVIGSLLLRPIGFSPERVGHFSGTMLAELACGPGLYDFERIGRHPNFDLVELGF